MREFQEEIARLKAHLDKKAPGEGGKKKRKKKTKRGPDGMVIRCHFTPNVYVILFVVANDCKREN